MNAYPRRTQALATSLAALAGFVDASGFILLGGFFVSFMSGNSTRLGVSLASGSRQAFMAGGLLATFVVGVILGSLVGRLAATRRRPAVLSLVALLLAAAAALVGAGRTVAAGVAMALAMGAENAVFESNGEVRFGLTYMTGTLVKLGQRIAAALLGGPSLGWVAYLILWAGLAGGGLMGACAFSRLGVHTLWLASAAAASLAVAAAWLGPDEQASAYLPE